jgi:hypothetical protein
MAGASSDCTRAHRHASNFPREGVFSSRGTADQGCALLACVQPGRPRSPCAPLQHEAIASKRAFCCSTLDSDSAVPSRSHRLSLCSSHQPVRVRVLQADGGDSSLAEKRLKTAINSIKSKISSPD